MNKQFDLPSGNKMAYLRGDSPFSGEVVIYDSAGNLESRTSVRLITPSTSAEIKRIQEELYKK